MGTCLVLEGLSVAAISQGIVAELVSLHLWPCGQIGKRIGLGVTVYKVFLITGMLTWVMIDPYNGLRQIFGQNSLWATEISSRLNIASIFCLVIGWTSLPLIFGQIFYPFYPVKEENVGKEEKEVTGEV